MVSPFMDLRESENSLTDFSDGTDWFLKSA
jgi:hypothetical protein